VNDDRFELIEFAQGIGYVFDKYLGKIYIVEPTDTRKEK